MTSGVAGSAGAPPQTSGGRDAGAARLVPLLAALLGALLAWLSSATASPTADEPTYLGQGAYVVRSGDFRAPVLLWQPPLALYVTSAALPLVDLAPGALDERPPDDALTALGDRLLFASPSPPEDVLRAARLPVAAAFGLTAALAAWLAARLGGTAAAVFAGALVAASPMFFSHGGLATTDAVATGAALLAAAVAATAAADRRPWTARRSLLAGAALGLALLAKHSAVALVPVVCGVAFVTARRDGRGARGALGAAGAALGAAALVVWAGYGFDVGTLIGPSSKGDVASRVAPDLPGIAWLARNLPVPAPRWWQSLAYQASKQHGRLSFHYFGDVAKVGWWTYFPVVALGKATLGSVVLAGAAAWTLRRRRPDAAEWALLAAFALPFAAAVVSRHNLGVRHVLPALAPLAVVVAVRIARDGLGSVPRVGALGAMLLLHVCEGAGAVPDGVAWWNMAAGGTAGGWRIATGSNADWGQGLWRLRDEVRARGLTDVHLLPGTGPESALARIEADGLRVLRDVTRRAPLPETGWLAVSTSVWRAPPHDAVTDAPPDLFAAGCYRLYRLPLRERTP